MAFVNDVKDGIHSSTIPTIVGPKVVFMRPGLLEFFTAISKFAARCSHFHLEFNEEVYYRANCRLSLSRFATPF
jgi:hypothetical protein